MAIVNSNPAADGEHALFKLAMDTTLVVAMGSLFLYLAASFHLDGYLESFGCDADWFDPSIFQLISFAKVSLFIALCLAGGIWWLLELYPFSRSWWGWYAAWLLVLVPVTLLCTVAQTIAGTPASAKWLQVCNSVVFAAIPLLFTTIHMRERRKAATGSQDLDLPSPPPRSEDDDRARDILSNPEAHGPEELRWAESHRQRRVAELERRMKELAAAVEKERAKVQQDLAELRRKRRFTIVAMLALTAWFAMQFSTMCGVAVAALDLGANRGGVREDSPDMQVQLLFTDGVRTLSRNLHGDVETVVYRNPEADLRLTVRVIKDGTLSRPQTRPTTMP